MSAIDPRSPCVVGVARETVRPGEGPAAEPLELWARVCRAAADDTGASNMLEHADSLQVVYCQSWPYDDPVGRLAETLGIAPGHRHYSGIGGTVPQVLVQSAAEEIMAGRMESAVFVAGEALDTVRRTKKAGERLPWRYRDPEKKPFPFEAPFHPAEIAHNVFQAWLTFPVFDIARRARLGIAPDAYRQQVGETLAPFSSVAAKSPHAWFPVARSAEELVTATPENRMVAYPYTKYEVSVMDVDMAAAVIVAATPTPTRSACRSTDASTYGDGRTPRTRCTWPSTPTWRRPRRWRTRPAPRSSRRDSRSTTSPTSTSTAASPALCTSRATPSAFGPTTHEDSR